jgi:hypothetical protein
MFKNFFLENLIFNETLWKKIVEPGRCRLVCGSGYHDAPRP